MAADVTVGGYIINTDTGALTPICRASSARWPYCQWPMM